CCLSLRRRQRASPLFPYTTLFRSDGWRAVIAEDFTFDNVRAVAQATAEYLLRTKVASTGVVIGYDTRFLSGSFAGAVAEVLAAKDRKSTRLNSSHVKISYAVFCLK